ncbi:MAG: hypothetical protein WA003_00330 [Desulfuromonadaceae bacterium]
MSEVDLKKLLQRAIELVMPNLRHYYRLLRKGRVVKAYASDGQYWADVQLLRNDESDDVNEPVITKVEIPILWGGPERGVVCPPAVGTLCDVEYYDGDPNYFRISNFRWAKNQAPACELGGFIIQQSPGVYFLITPAGKLEIKSNNSSMDMGTLDILADVNITGVLTVSESITATANITAGGNVADAGGVKTMAAMRGTFDAHTHQENGTGGGVTNPPVEGM